MLMLVMAVIGVRMKSDVGKRKDCLSNMREREVAQERITIAKGPSQASHQGMKANYRAFGVTGCQTGTMPRGNNERVVAQDF